MKTARVLVVVAMAAALLMVSGCVRQPLPERWSAIGNQWGGVTFQADNRGGVARQEETIALGTAKAATVRLEMLAGQLDVDGAEIAPDLMQARFVYAPEWRPSVSYVSVGQSGTLEVTQPDLTPRFRGSNPNSWDITLAEDVPLDLAVHMGAGTSDLDLSRLDVRKLVVDLGAGESRIDLTGPRSENVTGDITAGIGQLTVALPKDIGVRVVGEQSGIGNVEAEGFTHQGSALVNDAYGETATTIELTITRGIGEVVLELR